MYNIFQTNFLNICLTQNIYTLTDTARMICHVEMKDAFVTINDTGETKDANMNCLHDSLLGHWE